jgi:hypothetical protein
MSQSYRLALKCSALCHREIATQIYFAPPLKNVLTLKFFIGINTGTASILVATFTNIEFVQMVRMRCQI